MNTRRGNEQAPLLVEEQANCAANSARHVADPGVVAAVGERDAIAGVEEGHEQDSRDNNRRRCEGPIASQLGARRITVLAVLIDVVDRQSKADGGKTIVEPGQKRNAEADAGRLERVIVPGADTPESIEGKKCGGHLGEYQIGVGHQGNCERKGNPGEDSGSEATDRFPSKEINGGGQQGTYEIEEEDHQQAPAERIGGQDHQAEAEAVLGIEFTGGVGEGASAVIAGTLSARRRNDGRVGRQGEGGAAPDHPSWAESLRSPGR